MNEQENNTMYQIDFKKPMAIHFIGIGGISMSGLAEVLLEEGFTISGSDAKESLLPELWKKKAQKSTTDSGPPIFPIPFRLLCTLLQSTRTIRNSEKLRR